jgi:hypothetical protein
VNYLQFVTDSGNAVSDVNRMLRQMSKEHRALKVTIEPLRDTRSCNQNRLFSCFVRRLAQQAGTDFETMKMLVKRHAIGMGYPVARDEDGLLMEDNDGLIPLPSHKANTKEFSILISACEDLAYEYGFVLE